MRDNGRSKYVDKKTRQGGRGLDKTETKITRGNKRNYRKVNVERPEMEECAPSGRDTSWPDAAVPVNGPDTHQGNLSLSGSEVEEEILFGRCLGMARTPCWRPNKTTFPIMAATPCPAPRGEISQTYGHYYLQHRNYIKVITRSAPRETMALQVDRGRGTTAATGHAAARR